MRVFISFEERDRRFVERLQEKLESTGITPYTNNLKGFDPLTLQNLNRAMAGCNHVIVVLSPFYVKSDWMMYESGAFRIKEGATKREIIIPIVIKNCAVPEYLQKRGCVNFWNVDFDKAFEELKARIPRNRQIFIIMDYGDEMKPIYEKAIAAIEASGFTPFGREHLLLGGGINEQIRTEISRSELVLADLSCESPNCYYETGYSHALGKEILITMKKNTKLPFDLFDHPAIEWENPEDFEKKLNERLRHVQGSA